LAGAGGYLVDFFVLGEKKIDKRQWKNKETTPAKKQPYFTDPAAVNHYAPLCSHLPLFTYVWEMLELFCRRLLS
jgi:hypothetical protein